MGSEFVDVRRDVSSRRVKGRGRWIADVHAIAGR